MSAFMFFLLSHFFEVKREEGLWGKFWGNLRGAQHYLFGPTGEVFDPSNVRGSHLRLAIGLMK